MRLKTKIDIAICLFLSELLRSKSKKTSHTLPTFGAARGLQQRWQSCCGSLSFILICNIWKNAPVWYCWAKALFWCLKIQAWCEMHCSRLSICQPTERIYVVLVKKCKGNYISNIFKLKKLKCLKETRKQWTCSHSAMSTTNISSRFHAVLSLKV